MKYSKIHTLSGLLLAAFVFLSGCGGEKVATAYSLPVTEVTIGGDDRMRYDVTRFTVQAGQEISLTLRNVGLMPKESMGHNLVIIDKSLAANAFAAASIGHPRTAYIAPQYAAQVIAKTSVLGPGEEETITFVAPAEPGDYPFVCSFPGHTPAGMQGIMTVVR